MILYDTAGMQAAMQACMTTSAQLESCHQQALSQLANSLDVQGGTQSAAYQDKSHELNSIFSKAQQHVQMCAQAIGNSSDHGSQTDQQCASSYGGV